MTSDTKKEFLQKYMLDSYSRAIPTNALAEKSASLGEYCDPVDSYKGKKKRHTEDSEDSDPGYAQPQDALEGRPQQDRQLKAECSDDSDGADLYELAQNPVDSNDSPQAKRNSHKPSPKPRGSGKRTQASEPVSGLEVQLRKTSSRDNPQIETQLNSMSEITASGRRPSKKVVEIEYEIASEIRHSQHGKGPSITSKQSSPSSSSSSSSPALSQGKISTSNSITSNRSPLHRKSSGTQCSIGTPVTAPGVPQTAKPDFTYSISQQVDESMYEEPWDLKAKRLKQQEEERVSRSSLSKTNSISVVPVGMVQSVMPATASKIDNSGTDAPGTTEAIYEDAWDTAAQQRKFEAKLSYARTLSTTSETSDIFHDALDNLHPVKPEQPPEFPPLLTDTYEDAWDLKNNILEQKIREMQVQASATYEEPWDLKRQRQQLQARLSAAAASQSTSDDPNSNNANSIRSGSVASSPSPKTKAQRSSSCLHDQSRSEHPNGAESPSLSVRGKHHSSDESSSRLKAKHKGCNVGQRINPLIPLANQNWYHGNISRDDAEKMLCVCKEGSYIVRISTDRKSYSLSIKSAKQNIHVQIEQVAHPDSTVTYILGKNSKEFCSIPEMIDYYTCHRVPLKGAEHITLLHPVECKWSSSNTP